MGVRLLNSAFLPPVTRLSSRLSSSDTSQLSAIRIAPVPRKHHPLNVRSALNPSLATAAKTRARMRLNQQRLQEGRPTIPVPSGVPREVSIGITNVIPNGVPSHPNAARPAYVFVASANGDSKTIGDCPSSQRILMTLEEKYVPYEGRFIDVQNKPNWFLEINPEGDVPIMYINQKWVADADVILETIEQKISIPTFRVPPAKASVGLKIFPLFVSFLRSKDATDGSEQALIQELQALDEHLKTEDAVYKNPFVNGRFPSMVDMNLAPKLYQMEVALKHFKDWRVPLDLKYLDAYMKKLFLRPSFTKTKPPEELVICSWGKDLGIITPTSEDTPVVTPGSEEVIIPSSEESPLVTLSSEEVIIPSSEESPLVTLSSEEVIIPSSEETLTPV